RRIARGAGFGKRDMQMVSPEVRFLEHTPSIFCGVRMLLIGAELRDGPGQDWRGIWKLLKMMG
ncbi:MAG TPA: hypothetical protein VGG58_10470, partial [Candidatus Acidoferrum sp.]